MNASNAELTLAAQLEQAGIPFGTEVLIAKPRKFRWDFIVADNLNSDPPERTILVEIEGGTWIAGRHVQGAGFESGCEKQALAVLAGYRVFRATTRQVENGTALSWIRQALGMEVAA